MSRADRLRKASDVALYRVLVGRPQRKVVSSFYETSDGQSDVTFVGPMLRQEVKACTPTKGEHLLVYLNNGKHQFSDALAAAMNSLGAPVVVYGTDKGGTEGNITFKPLSNETFLQDLASCRALFSTAGNQLVGEALHLGKPLLVTPENTVEQRANAAAVVRMGVGSSCALQDIDGALLERFWNHAKTSDFERVTDVDGTLAAINAIETYAVELMRATGPTSALADIRTNVQNAVQCR